nr:G protein-coupled receptor [Proales similis]
MNEPNATNGPDPHEQLFKTIQLVTGLYLLPFISLLGMIGNLLNVIIYKRSVKNSTNLYLIALSLNDMLKLGNDFLYFIVNLLSRVDAEKANLLFTTLYPYSHYIFLFTALNTAWLTVAIAFDRWYVVAKHQTKQFIARHYRQAVGFCAIIIALSALISIPSPIYVSPESERSNATLHRLLNSRIGDVPLQSLYNYFNPSVKAFIPLVLLIYLDYLIVRIIYRNKMDNSRANKTKSSVTRMLLTIVLTFTICMIPDAILTVMNLGYANASYLIRAVREVTDLLLAINSASTFLICFYFSIEFRNKLYALCWLSVDIEMPNEERNSLFQDVKSRVTGTDRKERQTPSPV